MFILDETSQHVFRQKLQVFHGLFTVLKLKACALEELLYDSINTSPDYRGRIIWKSESHKPDCDYIIRGQHEQYNIELKSGTIRDSEYLTISSHRLTRFNSDFNQINHFLASKTTTQIISAQCDQDNNRYILRYFDARLLIPETDIRAWEPITNKKGILAGFKQTNSHGVILKIHISMSWQLWLEIPISIAYHTQNIDY
jgi:hypothetical protein